MRCPTPAEVAGRGPLSDHPARTTADVAEGLRATDPAEVAKAWAAHSASGDGDRREWDDAVRAVGADPHRARAEAALLKADVVDPAVASRDAARQVEGLAAARVVVAGDRTADRAVADDHSAVLAQLHGPDWAGHVTRTGADGATASRRRGSGSPAWSGDTCRWGRRHHPGQQKPRRYGITQGLFRGLRDRR